MEIPAANVWDGTEADAVETASEGCVLVSHKPEGCGVERVTQSLALDSNTDLYVYVACARGASVTSATFVDGTQLPFELAPDGRYRVIVAGIAAHELGRQWEISIGTSTGGTVTVETSALAWSRSALTYEPWRGDQVARNAAAAIWRYAKAAEAYKVKHP